MPVEAKNAFGLTREKNGKVEIFTEKGWTPYPPHAVALIEFATEHGWTLASDGLPVRTNMDSDLIIAVVLVRPDTDNSAGYTLRVPWVCEHTTFHVGEIVVKPSGGSWRKLPMLRDALKFIRDNGKE